MRSHTSRQTPGVRDGRVQHKNGRTPHPGNYYRSRQAEVIIDRQRPGDGYRHLLTVDHVRRFIGILPNWDELSAGLNAIVLAPGSSRYDGWYVRGVVAVCAWSRDLWTEYDWSYVEDHAEVFGRLAVPVEEFKTDQGGTCTRCRWEKQGARAYQLLHVLLHELGHHHDLVTSRSGRGCDRGEPYAEAYAYQYEAEIWDRYWQEFRG